MQRLLNVENLKVHFPIKRGAFGGIKHHVMAVDGVSLHIKPGETVGLVGESGCGKSTLGQAIVRLIEPTAGTIRFHEKDITRIPGRRLRNIRRHIQIIFQDPFASLNPRMTVKQTIEEALQIHRLARSKRRRLERVEQLLVSVGLNPTHATRYPHEFSGGQRQRIGIARALAVEPRLIVCDEPVSALDVSVQAQIINLLNDIQAEHNLAYLFIAHDLAVVEHISHRILVMYLGQIVESAEADIILRNPRHPYTRALISAIPTTEPELKRRRIILPGDVPSPITPPAGCRFHPRCPDASSECGIEVPSLRQIAAGHWAACHLA
ncbi:MAG: ATP-binding cassette domain-containing protein [Verrucomicrobia bacterium]|nr:ATP-binding cassette domain-containing protein [Verrucomicrobiota bacterium]MCF7707737.1 ATP-binding cassette domain-containing protein [Verrucomicrobiota bacterium]